MLFKYIFPDLYYAHKLNDPALWSVSYTDHFHTVYEMVYFIRGNAEFMVENKRYPLKSGNLVLVRPGSHHNIHLLSSAAYERYVVRFSEYIIPSGLLAKMEQLEGSFYVGDSYLPSLFKRFDDHFESIGDEPEVLKMLFRCVITEIIVYFCRFSGKEKGFVTLLKDDMAMVLEYINKNMESPLCLEDICKEFHYSKSYLCREFSSSMGVPLMSYVRTKKIIYADALLKSGMRPTEAAVWCGFTDYSTFYRLYKKLMGIPPSQKRKEIKSKI